MLEKARQRSPRSPMRVIACATVIEDMASLLPTSVGYQVFDFGLHSNGDLLKQGLQDAIDATPASVETIVLGYGLCSQAVVGLRSDASTLVVPRVDDCIGLFLGSDAAYGQQRSTAPGTYYLTKGWIEAGNGPFGEYDRMVERYGEEKAAWLMGRMLGHYTRLALITTGQHEIERYQAHARQTAEQFDLRYEEIPGSTSLLKKLIQGPWDDDVVVVPPGSAITFADFHTTAPSDSGEAPRRKNQKGE